MGRELKKIILIGPVYPYKGGISHYTGLLYKSLAKKYDVTMISYSFQYPKLLYKKEQRDFSNDTFNIEETQYLLHTANPINWFTTARKIQNMRPDLVIIQWWHPYFAPCYQAIAGRLRSKGIKTLFVCHNVFPHERFPLDRLFTKKTLQKGNYFIVQSTQDEEDLKSIIPGARYTRAVHPTYNAFKMQDMSKEEARKQLGIKDDEKIILFFGFVRKYKGLDYLIDAMPDIVERLPDCKLLVVGDFGEDKQEYLERISKAEVAINNCVSSINNAVDSEEDKKACGSAINVYDGYIPDKEVEKFFAACDVVVLPYISATQSGIVQIAYGFDKPVIATNVGGLPDVVTDGKTGFLIKPESARDIVEAVTKFFEPGVAERLMEEVQQESYRFSWDKMVCIIARMVCNTF